MWLRVPGFSSAERYKLPPTEAQPIRYVALYFMNSTDPDAALDELTKRAGTPEMVMSTPSIKAGIEPDLDKPCPSKQPCPK